MKNPLKAQLMLRFPFLKTAFYFFLLLVTTLALAEAFLRFNKSWINSLVMQNLTEQNLLSSEGLDLPLSIRGELQRAFDGYKSANFEDKRKILALNERAKKEGTFNPLILRNPVISELDIREFSEKASIQSLGLKLYDVKYRITQLNYRHTPLAKPKQKTESIILLGCSYTFGLGVEDEHTIANYLQKKLPDYTVFNFGIPGAGLNDILDDHLKVNRLAKLKLKKSYAIYSFYHVHLDRTFCLNECHQLDPDNNWVYQKTNYDIAGSDLVDQGTFWQSRRVENYLNSLFYKTEIWRLLKSIWSDSRSPESMKKFILMLKVLEKKLNQSNAELLVYLPEYGIDPTVRQFQLLLQKEGIKTLHIKPHQQDRELIAKEIIIGDGHYNDFGSMVEATYIEELFKNYKNGLRF